MVFLCSRAHILTSDIQAWPILGRIDTDNPFIIALFCGSGKPNSIEEFLNEFLEEHQRLSGNGMVLENTTKSFKLKGFTCDAPARQMLKSIKLPSEFARQPRSLAHLKQWKATEFKQFALCTGMYVLKGIVPEDIYNHFLCLSVLSLFQCCYIFDLLMRNIWSCFTSPKVC